MEGLETSAAASEKVEVASDFALNLDFSFGSNSTSSTGGGIAHLGGGKPAQEAVNPNMLMELDFMVGEIDFGF